MAAPASKTLKDLNGKWNLVRTFSCLENKPMKKKKKSWRADRQPQNKNLSDSPDAGLALQGIGFLTRKAIGVASISIAVSEYEGPAGAGPFTHIDLEQSASGLTSTKERRCVDDHARPDSDWLFGAVESRSRWATVGEVGGGGGDAFLASGWLTTGPDGDAVLVNLAVSKDKGWTATQVWGFQEVKGERRYCRNIVVEKGGKRAEFRLVYDYVG